MRRLLAVVGVAGAVGGLAYLVLRPEPPLAADRAGSSNGQSRRASAKPAPFRALGRRGRGTGMARTATERAGAEPGPPESTAPAPDAIAFDEAREGFETVLARIDDMVDQRVTLDPRSYDEWRGRANAAFAAYQTFIDANTPEGRARLDEAHRELARALRALERRVRRDPRRPEWMDAVP